MNEYLVWVGVRLQAEDARQAATVVRGALAQEELACEIGSVHGIIAGTPAAEPALGRSA